MYSIFFFLLLFRFCIIYKIQYIVPPFRREESVVSEWSLSVHDEAKYHGHVRANWKLACLQLRLHWDETESLPSGSCVQSVNLLVLRNLIYWRFLCLRRDKCWWNVPVFRKYGISTIFAWAGLLVGDKPICSVSRHLFLNIIPGEPQICSSGVM